MIKGNYDFCVSFFMLYDTIFFIDACFVFSSFSTQNEVSQKIIELGRVIYNL